MEAEHAVHPRAAPAVLGEQPPGGLGAAGRSVDAVVDQHREARVVRDPVAGRRVPGLEPHAYRSAGSSSGSPKRGNTPLSPNHVMAEIWSPSSVRTMSPYGRAITVSASGR